MRDPRYRRGALPGRRLFSERRGARWTPWKLFARPCPETERINNYLRARYPLRERVDDDRGAVPRR